MEIAKIAAVGIVAAVLAITLKKTNPEISLQVSLAAGIVILLMSVKQLREAVKFVREFSERFRGSLEVLTVVMKIVGIAYICEFAAQALRDCGEGSIAAKIELGGKLVMMTMTLPLFAEFITLVMRLAEEI